MDQTNGMIESEKNSTLTAMLQSIADHISIMDTDMNIVWANDVAKERFGNDIIGRKCYQVYHNRSTPCEPSPCISKQALSDGKVHEHETEVIDKEGNSIFFHCTANVALRDAYGKPIRVIEISRDITDRKLIEKRLEQSETILNSAQQISKIGGWEWDIISQKMYWTDELYRLHGVDSKQYEYGSNEHIELSLKCYDPDDRKVILSAFSKCIEDGVAYDLEFPFTKQTGERIWVRTVTKPVYANGQITKVIGNLMDITDRKEAEKEAMAQSERSRIFFSSVDDAIFVHPLKMEGFAPFVEVNDIACKRYGYTRREFLKLSAPDITRKSDSNSHGTSSHREKLLEAGRLVFESVHIRKSGEEFPVEINSNIIDQGAKPYILSVVRDISERKKAEEERERLIRELQDSLSEVKVLSGLLPICASCKKIRDDKGYWRRIEAYISSHSGAEFSHGICPECAKKLYPDYFGEKKE